MKITNLRKTVLYLQETLREEKYADDKELLEVLDILVVKLRKE
jgi:hypothetical protein